ncbi:MAG: NAD(P)/FAD-dependent oxidoreductase [Oceanicoccus sp.]
METSNNSEDLLAKSVDELGFDPEVLRNKYRQERDKRLRVDGNDQYVEVTGEYSHFVDDPYIETPVIREPLSDEVDVIVIGGGFGGLLTGARLRQAGVANIRLVEKGGNFGGTWYWNRYPGAACDIESYVYLPLLEEMGFVPERKFIDGKDILAYSQSIAKKFDLYDNACLQTEVTETRWDESIQRWIVSTNRGDQMKARFICMSNGPLHRPKLPGIPGIDTFKGHTFHTSRWDYQYTGGSAEGNLSGLKDKRVGVIGTGATAVQCVPHLGASAQQLYVFQRTPSSVDFRNDPPTDKKWFNSQEPGWHQHRMDNFNILVSGGYAEEDLVNDGWTDIIRNLLLLVQTRKDSGMSPEALAELAEIADFQKMEEIRGRVETEVSDQAIAEALKPYYRQFCKRPCFHNEYLATFNRPNVLLVDTKGRGVEQITEKGVMVDGVEYELDCLVFATGFEVGTGYVRRSGYDVVGHDGITLSDKWSERVSSLHGMHTRGFPNCFILGNIQAGFTANYPHALNEEAKHISYIVSHVMDNDLNSVEASAQAESDWVETIIDYSQFNEKFLEDCTPGYYNGEGKSKERLRQHNNYGKGSEAFFERMREWRSAGDLSGLEVK